jgi:hypothetical protein
MGTINIAAKVMIRSFRGAAFCLYIHRAKNENALRPFSLEQGI